MSIIWTLSHIEHKHDFCRQKDCMKKICGSLTEREKNIIDFEKKKMLLLTNNKKRVCYICGKMILKKLSKNINYRKVKNHCHYDGKYRGTAHSTCKFKFDTPNEILVLFPNGLNHALRKNWPHSELLWSIFLRILFTQCWLSFYHKKLANNFEGQFEYLGENTEKYNFFPILIEIEVSNIDRDGNESVATIS